MAFCARNPCFSPLVSEDQLREAFAWDGWAATGSNPAFELGRWTQPHCAPKDYKQRHQSGQRRHALLTARRFHISLARPPSLPPISQGSPSQATNRITHNFSPHSSRSLTSGARDKPSAVPAPPPLKQGTRRVDPLLVQLCSAQIPAGSPHSHT